MRARRVQGARSRPEGSEVEEENVIHNNPGGGYTIVTGGAHAVGDEDSSVAPLQRLGRRGKHAAALHRNRAVLAARDVAARLDRRRGLQEARTLEVGARRQGHLRTLAARWCVALARRKRLPAPSISRGNE